MVPKSRKPGSLYFFSHFCPYGRNLTYTSCYGVAVVQVGGRASLLPAKHSQHSKEPEEEELHCVECTVASAASGCGVPGCTLCTSLGVQHRPQPEGGLCRGGGADSGCSCRCTAVGRH